MDSKVALLASGERLEEDTLTRSDNLSQLTEHMSFSLPSRDMIADSMEMVRRTYNQSVILNG
jgi:dihydroxyacid dehydratase/phosphogluconate dehydratase